MPLNATAPGAEKLRREGRGSAVLDRGGGKQPLLDLDDRVTELEIPRGPRGVAVLPSGRGDLAGMRGAARAEMRRRDAAVWPHQRQAAIPRADELDAPILVGEFDG